MSCKHDCPKPPAFPRTIFNRPGLDRIDYRIGTYALVREHLLDRLNAQPALAAWTHRGTDDPGIALLESDAIVVDILTFYQSLYANEAYLRTAQWSQSIADLVRLGGYRLAPGVAGETTFALTVQGERTITVPVGFGLKAQIEGIDKPVDFETREMLDAVPALGRFALYRPRTVPPISAGMREICFGDTSVVLKADDRLLLGAASGGVNTLLSAPEIAVVEETWDAFGLRYVRLKSPLRRSVPIASLRAYKLGESFRHFGHQAPDTIATVSSQGVPSQRTISFLRYTALSTTTEVDPDLAATEIALDRGFDKLVPGESVIVQGRFSVTGTDAGQRFTFARRVADAEQRSLRWGSLSGASTVLSIEQTLSVLGYAYYDVRSITIWQTQGTAFAVHAAPVHTAAMSGDILRYYGRSEDAQTLVGRRLLLAHPDGTVDDCVVHALLSGAPGGFGFNTMRLSRAVDYADFGYEGEVATAYGNVIDADQGKTVDRTPIGSGDARALFQTFALPKTPLTYLFDATSTPAQVPALEIFVDDLRWTRVDTLFSSGPDHRVYIVREDHEGNSIVQFGDGKTGARLSSGRNNVVAQYRIGIAAHGGLKPDTTPQATGKLDQLDKVFLPVEVDTGAPAETADNARRAAPVRLQSLGRLVSLADYEAETRMLPNVVKAAARWAAPDGVPTVVLTVLTASGSEADNIAIRDALTGYSRCRGPARYPFTVLKGYRQYVHLHAAVGYDPTYTIESLGVEIKRALGVAGQEAAGIDGREGLFGIDRREFRSTVHTSEILAAIQNLPGVVWVELRAADAIPLGVPPETDPVALALPAVDLVPAPVLACPSQALLALHARHLVLSFAVAAATSECTP